MEMIFRALMVLTLTPGALCQEIIVGPPKLTTPCTSKSRQGKDRFEFNGTIGRDFANLVAQGWQTNFVLVAFHLHSKFYNILCLMEFEGGNTCSTNTPETCTCVYRNRQIHFMINYTLATFYSRRSLTIHWASQVDEHRYVLADKNYTLPEICGEPVTEPAAPPISADLNTAHLTLTIAGTLPTLPTTRHCSFTLTLGTSNLMQLCCSNMAMPCYSQIKFRGVVVASDESPCVTYASTVDGVTAPLQLSYSVCTKTEYRQGNNCTILRGVVTTRVPPPTTAVVTTRFPAPTAGVVTTRVREPATDIDIPEYSETTSDGYATTSKAPTTVQPSQRESNTLQILFWAALLLIILVIICALVTLWIILRRKKEQDEIRESVRGSLSKTAEVEPPEEVEEPESIESASTVSKLESEV